MEYSPPPFFKQGPSARARLIFFSVLSITLLIADARFNALVSIRAVIATILYPVQRATLLPGQLLGGASTYFAEKGVLTEANERLLRENTALAQSSLLVDQLTAENTELRGLLGTRTRQPVQSIAAEILYDARDPSSRKIVLDRGTQHGVHAGSPVIDDAGVVGQVTRAFPFVSEVTLLTDKNQAIPVQDLRSGLRAVAYGGAERGLLNLRFMAANADIRAGDELVTSGIDGVYPTGLPVARVQSVEGKTGLSFAEILCVPIGGVDRNRHLLVLNAEALPSAPPPEVVPEGRRPRKGSA
jgi:rod shape-determining protein MreC